MKSGFAGRGDRIRLRRFGESALAPQARVNDNYAASFGRFFRRAIPISCPICKMETVADAAFCNHCGERLPALCRGCGALNPPGSGFCYACGSPIAASSRFSPPPPARISCPRCSKTNEPGSAFCYSCGMPLDEPPLRADERIHSYAAPRIEPRATGFGGYREYASVEEPGGFWIRAVAYLIDYVVSAGIAFAVLLTIMIAMFTAGYGASINGAGGDALIWIVVLLSLILYRAIGWSIWSTTVGKHIFNLYVVRTDGSKIGFWRAFARCLCYAVSELPLMLGFLMAAFRRDKRGLHDLICDTAVVRRRR